MSTANAKKDEITYTNEEDQYVARFWIGADDIVYAKVRGFEGLTSSKEVVRILGEYSHKLNRKLAVCLDATDYSGLAPESRKYMGDNLLHSDSAIERFAVIGGNLLTRTMFNMYSKIADIPMRVFKSEVQAVSWLNER